MQLTGTEYTLELAPKFLLLTHTVTKAVKRVGVDTIQRLENDTETHTLTMAWEDQEVAITYEPHQAAAFGLFPALWSPEESVIPFHALERLKTAVKEAENAEQRQWFWLGTLKGVGIIGLPACFGLATVTYALDKSVETWPSQFFWFLGGVAFWTYGLAGAVKWLLPKLGQTVTRKNLAIGSVVASLLFNLWVGTIYSAGSDAGSYSKVNNTVVSEVTPSPTVPPIALKIVAVEDKSQKFIPGRLSEYSVNELNDRLMMTRKAYRVIIPEGFQESQVEQAAQQLVEQVTQDDPDLDAAIFWVYSDKAHIDAGQAYDVAMITWAPGGSWANLTEDILKTNDRRGYSTKIEVEEGFEQRLAARSKDETKFGLTEEQRRQVFKERVMAQHKADRDAEERYPTDGQHISQAYLETHVTYLHTRKDHYDAQVRQKYHLTEAQYGDIFNEAVEEDWPLPAMDEWLD